jgi:DNA-binding NarL/FixJ family response regulator
MTIRVLIVDDHPVFRDGLAAALAASPDIEVTGQRPSSWPGRAASTSSSWT